jgi:glycosyltransferase involved in cell wall biosynthesis
MSDDELMMPRPTIAIVAASLRALGGQGVQASSLVLRLSSEGYRVIFLPVDPAFPPAIRWIRRLPCVRTLLNQALYLPSLLALRRARVVHVFSAAYWSFLISPAPAMLAARSLGKRVILNYHSGEADDHLGRWGRFMRPWMRLADEIVVPSEYLRGVFERHGYPARVIPNVVDLSSLRFRRRDPLRPRLLSTRNLEPLYGVDMTLKAFAILKARFPQATLTIAGTGSQEKPLRRLAASLNLDGLSLVGRVEPADMPSLYDDHDIFVNSSLVDNQPLSILEAFAAGTPVVSTGPGGIPAMVRDGETGLLVRRRDPEAMAAAVASLLTDPASARAMARRAREESRNHTWPRVRERWLAAYAGAPS